MSMNRCRSDNMPPIFIHQHKNGMLTPISPSTAVATTKAGARKTTKKGGKSRGVAKAPRGGRRARPAAAMAAVAAAPNASAAAPTMADATMQADGKVAPFSSCSTPLHTKKPNASPLQRFAIAVIDQFSCIAKPLIRSSLRKMLELRKAFAPSRSPK